MKVRVTFRVETYIDAENIEEARDKFDNASLFAQDTGVEGVSSPDFVELVSVEDADTYEDLYTDF